MPTVPGLETKNSALAIFLSLFWPDLGQLYAGNVVRAVAMLFVTLALYGFTWVVIDVSWNSNDQQLLSGVPGVGAGALLGCVDEDIRIDNEHQRPSMA